MSAKKKLVAEPKSFLRSSGRSRPVLLIMWHSCIILKIGRPVTNCRNGNAWCRKKVAGRFLNVSQETGALPKCAFQKFLARTTTRLQGRCAMSTSARSINHGRTFVATCVFAAFVWAIALSVSPQLHQRVHADASRADHSCAVTAIASGNCNRASHPPLVSAPVPSIHFATIPALTQCWVQSPFLGACIFEHAPPTLS